MSTAERWVNQNKELAYGMLGIKPAELWETSPADFNLMLRVKISQIPLPEEAADQQTAPQTVEDMLHMANVCHSVFGKVKS